MTLAAVAAVGDPQLVSCGADDCEEDHRIYPPDQLVLVMEGITEGMVDEHDLREPVQECYDRGTLYKGKTRIYTTLLGLWWDQTFEPFQQN
jgi:hypothetical protein